MGNTTTIRADDDRLLEWLHLRDIGVTAESIGPLYGYTSSHVRTATNRVYDAMKKGHPGVK